MVEEVQVAEPDGVDAEDRPPVAAGHDVAVAQRLGLVGAHLQLVGGERPDGDDDEDRAREHHARSRVIVAATTPSPASATIDARIIAGGPIDACSGTATRQPSAAPVRSQK